MRDCFRTTTPAVWVILLMVLWGSCANIGRPSGGDRDTAGPELIGTIPFPGTLNFQTNEIVFYFDEFLKPGNYKDEIFISPVPEVDPQITVKNKTLKIKFLSPLKDSTTYVITLGTGIADFNEGNKMTKSFTYAFATGDVLDSLHFSGNVTDMWSGKGEKNMKVILFPSNKIEGGNILGIRPDYVSVTDQSGNFEFKFLAPGAYRLFAVSDADNDYKYSNLQEKVAISERSEVVLTGSDSATQSISMVSFYQDLSGPKVKTVKWANDFTIHVEFAEPIRPLFGSDSLSVLAIDSVNGKSEAVVNSRFGVRDRRHLYLHSPLPRSSDFALRFTNLMDSLGHKVDTLVSVARESQVREERGKWFETPVNLPRGNDFLVPSFFKLPVSMDSSMVQLRDTSGVFQPMLTEVVGFHLVGSPTEPLKPGMPYRLEFRPRILKPDNTTLDTLVKLDIKFPNPDELGTISGRVLPDSLRPDAKFMAIFRGVPGSVFLVQPAATAEAGTKGGASKGGPSTAFEQRFQAPAPFRFNFLRPGKYSMDIIDDTDGNGVLTPGSLEPHRMPEKVYHQDGKLEIRAKWDFKDVEVYPIPGIGKNKGGKGDSDENGDGTDEESGLPEEEER